MMKSCYTHRVDLSEEKVWSSIMLTGKVKITMTFTVENAIMQIEYLLPNCFLNESLTEKIKIIKYT